MFTMSTMKNITSSASEAAQHLVPEWLEKVTMECESEVKSGIKLLKGRSRLFVWNMAHALGAFPKTGVPAQACRLLERYLHTEIYRQISTWEIEEVDDFTTAWSEYKSVLGSKMALLAASCIQLTTKMDNAGVIIHGNYIQAVLASRGLFHCLDDINQSEMHVLRSVNFRLPLWTSLEITLMLAHCTGFPPDGYVKLTASLDFAEFRRDEITRLIAVRGYLTNHDEPIGVPEDHAISTLHLSAAALLASWRGGSEPLDQLSVLVRARRCYLSRLSILIKHQIQEYYSQRRER